MRFATNIALSFTLAAAGFAAFAQNVSLTGAPAGAGKKEAVARVLKLQQPAIEGLASEVARDTAQRVMAAAAQAVAAMPADKQQALGKQVQADIKAFYDDAEPRLREAASRLAPATLGPLLEEKFTDDELKQVAAWLESPVSKKYQALGPEMQGTLAKKLVEDTRPAIEPKLKALEQTLQKRFAQAAPPKPASAPASAAKPATKK
ncbi:MAG: DUF2059 domain-containing protein [Pseudomonadota bacterium]